MVRMMRMVRMVVVRVVAVRVVTVQPAQPSRFLVQNCAALHLACPKKEQRCERRRAGAGAGRWWHGSDESKESAPGGLALVGLHDAATGGADDPEEPRPERRLGQGVRVFLAGIFRITIGRSRALIRWTE